MKAEEARCVQSCLADLALAVHHLDQGDPDQCRERLMALQERLLDLEGLVGVSTPLSLFESA